MKVYVISTETNEVVFQSDEVYRLFEKSLYDKEGEKQKYFAVEDRNGYTELFKKSLHRVFKEVQW